MAVQRAIAEPLTDHCPQTRILLLLLEISHVVCLYHRCTLIMRQIKMVGVAAGSSTKKILTIWVNAMEMNNQRFPGLSQWRTLDWRPTRGWLVAVANVFILTVYIVFCIKWLNTVVH